MTEEQLQKVREPIPFTPTKRLQRDDILYATEKDIPHPILGYAEAHKEYSVIDLRGYRKGYEPRLEISGIYTPNPEDIFRLQTGKLPPYQPTTTGDKLLAEMRRLGVHTAFRIGREKPKAVPTVLAKATCYEDAWRFQIKEEEGILVHGEVTGADGKTVKHAWIELPTGYVWEPQTKDFYKKEVFEKTFSPKEDARYTVEEAAIQVVRKGYHGAWAEEVRPPAVEAPNPKAEPATVKCPLCGEVVEIPQYNQITRSDALSEHIRKEHAGYRARLGESNPMTKEEINQIATRTADEVMDRIRGQEYDSLLLHSVPYSEGSPGIVVDEALAKATPCQCIEYRPGKKLCFSKGIIGALSDEEEKIYCPTTVPLESPGLEKRLEDFMKSVKTCKAEIAEIPKGERLDPWLGCMSRELTTKGLQAG